VLYRTDTQAGPIGHAVAVLHRYANAMEPGQRRRDTTYTAPIGCVDLAAFDENGEPYEIHGCDYCLPWHAEVHIDDDGDVFIREWHAVECEAFEELVNISNRSSDS